MITVEIRLNHLTVLADNQQVLANEQAQFSSKRLIIHDFLVFVDALKKALLQAKVVYPFRFRTDLLGIFSPTPVHFHVCEPLEGGLSNVEGKALRDAAQVAGIKLIRISDLNDTWTVKK